MAKCQPLEKRFWSKVDVRSADECWPWMATRHYRDGYGQFYYGGTMVRAHNVGYMLRGRTVPDGLMLDHLCRVRHCCNPDHLEPVTNKENVLRGEGPSAKNARKTHCKRGHEFTEANTRLIRGGHRECRECTKVSKRAWYERNRDNERVPVVQNGSAP